MADPKIKPPFDKPMDNPFTDISPGTPPKKQEEEPIDLDRPMPNPFLDEPANDAYVPPAPPPLPKKTSATSTKAKKPH